MGPSMQTGVYFFEDGVQYLHLPGSRTSMRLDVRARTKAYTLNYPYERMEPLRPSWFLASVCFPWAARACSPLLKYSGPKFFN